MHVTNAEQAIARSISHNEIVTIEHNPQIAEILQRDCEGSVDNSTYGVVEYWGTIEDGSEWRVHMRAASTDSTPDESLDRSWDDPRDDYEASLERREGK